MDKKTGCERSFQRYCGIIGKIYKRGMTKQVKKYEKQGEKNEESKDCNGIVGRGIGFYSI